MSSSEKKIFHKILAVVYTHKMEAEDSSKRLGISFNTMRFCRGLQTIYEQENVNKNTHQARAR